MSSPLLPIAAHSPALDVVCSGSPLEMGRQQGRELIGRIEECAVALRSLEPFRLQQPRWLPFVIYQRLAEQRAARFLSTALRTNAPSIADRLLGIAQGSGSRMSTIYLINAMEAVLSDISRSTTVPTSAACSALAVGGPLMDSGTPLLAHNFDYLPLVQPFYSVRECHPTGGLRSLEFTAAPLAGAVDGLNEAGLAISYNYAYAIDASHPAPTISMRISDVLSHCRTAGEAVESFEKTDHWGGGILMLADASGDLVSLELSNHSLSARRPPSVSPVISHTNCFHCQETSQAQLPSDSVYSEQAPAALRGKRVHHSSEERNARFAELLAGRSGFDRESIETIMSDHGVTGEPSGRTICMHSDYWYTTACIRMHPVERVMRISYGPACAAQFVELSLA